MSQPDRILLLRSAPSPLAPAVLGHAALQAHWVDSTASHLKRQCGVQLCPCTPGGQRTHPGGFGVVSYNHGYRDGLVVCRGSLVWNLLSLVGAGRVKLLASQVSLVFAQRVYV